MDKLLKYFFLFWIVLFPFLSKAQQVVEEVIPFDTTFITYKVIYTETLGDYFQLKRAVFADNPNMIAIEKNFSNGVQNGITRIYYPSGKLRIKAIYGNGKLQGEWVNYGEDGVIITKGVYNFGVKHGYWAYKSLKTYGRYSNGVKHRKWIKQDVNNQKFKAFYWKGNLKKGSAIFNENYKTHADTLFATGSDSLIQVVVEDSASNYVDEKYVLALKHLAQNYYFRKVAKDYFRLTKKERAKFIDNYVDLTRDVFKFNVNSTTVNIDINNFLTPEKLLKPTIDSLLKISGKEIQQELLNTENKEFSGLKKYSTDKNGSIVVFVSKIINNVLVAEIVEIADENKGLPILDNFNNPKNTSMKVIFLFNAKNEIFEVEFQKRVW